MDELDILPPHRTRLNTEKKKAEKGNSSGKHGDKTTEAPTAKAAMDTLRMERDKWKACAEFLEEKLSDVTSERGICRTQLSDVGGFEAGSRSQRQPHFILHSTPTVAFNYLMSQAILQMCGKFISAIVS
ncbi:hypothetical protein ABVT39_005830 [Epinephelus coioides]